MREEAIEHSGGVILVGSDNGVQVETFSIVMIDSLKNRNRFDFILVPVSLSTLSLLEIGVSECGTWFSSYHA